MKGIPRALPANQVVRVAAWRPWGDRGRRERVAERWQWSREPRPAGGGGICALAASGTPHGNRGAAAGAP